MDGRQVIRSLVSCGLLASAVGCKQTTTDPAMTKPDLSTLTPNNTKSFWAGSKTPPPPLEGTAAAAPAKKPMKGPPKADTDVAVADAQLAVAFNTPPPGNRDQLIDMGRQLYQRALVKDPKNAGATLGIARLYARLGDKEHAMEWYKKYLDANPKDHEMAFEIAKMHARLNDTPGAVVWCEKALKFDPENRTYRKTLAFILAQSGRWDDAFASLCRIMPEPEARYNIARVLERNQMTEASKMQLQLALKADPNFTPAREFLADFDGAPLPVPTTEAEANPVQQTGAVGAGQ